MEVYNRTTFIAYAVRKGIRRLWNCFSCRSFAQTPLLWVGSLSIVLPHPDLNV
jgi:hypothetical protein